MKKIIVTLLLLPLLTFAEAGELTVGGQTIAYDSSTTTGSGVMFYYGPELVASEHGAVMIIYNNEQAVLEAHDISGDGEFDTFVSLDTEEEVTKIEGEGVDAFERPEPVEFAELLAEEGAGASDEDLVGSVDSITIPSSGSSMWFFIFLVVSVVAGWWYFKGKSEDEDR